MAVTIANSATPFVETATTTTHDISLTISAGTARKVVLLVAIEHAAAISAAYDPAGDNFAMSSLVAVTNTGDSNNRVAAFYVDLSDAYSGTGSKTIRLTSGSTPNVTLYAYQLAGAATGAAEDTGTGEANNTVTSVSCSSITTTTGAIQFAAVNCSSATPTWDSWGGITERSEQNETNYTSALAYDSLTAGAQSLSATASGTSGFKVIAAFSIAAATGLTITSVDSDNDVYSAQADVAVVGTGLSAGVTVTFKTFSCTVLSASSSTSIKITFPDFFSNNIKIGAQHEFKIVG